MQADPLLLKARHLGIRCTLEVFRLTEELIDLCDAALPNLNRSRKLLSVLLKLFDILYLARSDPWAGLRGRLLLPLSLLPACFQYHSTYVQMVIA